MATANADLFGEDTDSSDDSVVAEKNATASTKVGDDNEQAADDKVAGNNSRRSFWICERQKKRNRVSASNSNFGLM